MIKGIWSGIYLVFGVTWLLIKIVPLWIWAIIITFNVVVIFLKKERESRIYNNLYFPPGRYLSPKVRHKVWHRDHGRCVECGSQNNLQFDYIIPFSKGGSNAAENIQILCESCNKKKSNKI